MGKTSIYGCGSPICVVAINRGIGVELKSSYLVLSLLHIWSPLPLPTIAFHIEVTPLADGTYELIQEPDEDISEAQTNVVELTEVLNSDSEEPKLTNPIDTTTGKTRCIVLLF